MMMHFRRVSSVAALTAVALTASLAGSAAAQENDRQAAEPAYFVVNADIDVRSGAADSYYPFGKLERGDVVEVIGEKHEWARVLTTGPAFKDFFAFLRFASSEADRFKLEDGGKRGRTQGMTRVLAPNMNTGYDPNDSWKRIQLLEGDRVVQVLETYDDGRLIVHKIALPAGAEGWINKRFLEPATEAQIATWKTAVARAPDERITKTIDRTAPVAARDVSTESVLAREEPVVPSIRVPGVAGDQGAGRSSIEPDLDATGLEMTSFDTTGAEATTLADEPAGALDAAGPTMPALEPEKGLAPLAPKPAPARSPKERLEDLEEAYGRLREEPIVTAEVVPMRALYLDLANASVDVDDVFRYAQARAEQLAIWADLQQRRTELSRLRKRLDLTAEESRAVQLALEASGLYVAVGRLSASTIYDGSRLPRLFRIQDVSSGRTIAYVRPDDGFDYYPMLGQLIGVVGRKHRSEELGLNIVEPKRIDLLSEQTG